MRALPSLFRGEQVLSPFLFTLVMDLPSCNGSSRVSCPVAGSHPCQVRRQLRWLQPADPEGLCRLRSTSASVAAFCSMDRFPFERPGLNRAEEAHLKGSFSAAPEAAPQRGTNIQASP